MSDTQQRIGFIGGGRVARILVGGWRHAGVVPGEIFANEPDDAAFAQLAELEPGVRRASLADAGASDVVFVALHPPMLASVMAALRPCLAPEASVVSLAPKVPLSALAAGLGTARVARMIPNAPSIIGRGYNPVAFGDGVDAAVREKLGTLFAPWGAWPAVPEGDLEAYAILTGMGPTYYWYQWQALRAAAGQFGLSPERTDEALRHMLDGALATLLQSGLPPAGVMDLIPVRPLQAIEESVTAAYGTALPALFAKIRPTA
ncbi:MAG: NAD(P)-binding domain-containing protein [Vicinamibacterales bacterium]|nr:NAD(P)-binding domain-containing protein [Vicinamibacterales bacterium]